MNAPVLREGTAADLPRLATIYTESVRMLGPQAYTPEQVDAWARWPTNDSTEFTQRLTAGHTWVAEVDGMVAAFAEFTPPDHLDFLYTHGDYARRGLASALHQKLETIARAAGAGVLRTEASHLSRPAFTKFGYHVFETETVIRSGTSFTRFKMRKRLRTGPPATGKAQVAIHPHASTLTTSPTAVAGESVIFATYDETNPGWFKGTDSRGIEGFFPTGWFHIDATTHRAVATRDYDSRELTITAPEWVYPVETVGPWSWVRTAAGTEGWLPNRGLQP